MPALLLRALNGARQMGVSKFRARERQAAIRSVLRSLSAEVPNLHVLLSAGSRLFDGLGALAASDHHHARLRSLRDQLPNLQQLQFLVPIQRQLAVSLPVSGVLADGHDPFPESKVRAAARGQRTLS